MNRLTEAGLPPLADEKPFPVPDVSMATLPNGLTLWIVRRARVPLVSMRVVSRGGRSLDPPALPGFANLLANALREGTRNRTGPELTERLQAAGGELLTEATEDSLTVAVSGLAEKAGVLLDTLADVVREPAFPGKGVARVKALAHEELATNETDPFFLAERAFRKAVYGTHPYGVISPTVASIDATTPELLRQEAARRLVPDRALLLIVGDIDPVAAEAAAREAFAAWTGDGSALAEPPDAAPPPGPRVLRAVDRPGSVQTNLVVGGLGLARKDADAVALGLAITVYGGAFSSRLVTNLREEKGYTYSPGAGARSALRKGTVASTAAVRNDVTGASLGEILHEMSRMATTDVTDEELGRAKRRDLGVYAITTETNAGLANELTALWLNGLPPEEMSRRLEALKQLTKADLRRVSKKYLSVGLAQVVAVGDAKVIREELESFGEVEVTA